MVKAARMLPKLKYKHTFSKHNWQYLWFCKTFFPCPVMFLPAYNRFYQFKWWVDGCLREFMQMVNILQYKAHKMSMFQQVAAVAA